jgi:hypothetical protein
MAGSSLASLMCETRSENGSEDPCIASLSIHLGQLDRVSQRFIGNPTHRDLVTFGPYVGRSILESSLTAILLRFDPFRSRSLDRFARHPRYDANDVFKHRIQWSGDIYPSEPPPTDTWNPEQKNQTVSRALFSAHTIDAAWVPAAEAMLDFAARESRLLDLGFFQSQTPQIAFTRWQTKSSDELFYYSTTLRILAESGLLRNFLIYFERFRRTSFRARRRSIPVSRNLGFVLISSTMLS